MRELLDGICKILKFVWRFILLIVPVIKSCAELCKRLFFEFQILVSVNAAGPKVAEHTSS